jgi:hypothetical protein
MILQVGGLDAARTRSATSRGKRSSWCRWIGMWQQKLDLVIAQSLAARVVGRPSRAARQLRGTSSPIRAGAIVISIRAGVLPSFLTECGMPAVATSRSSPAWNVIRAFYRTQKPHGYEREAEARRREKRSLFIRVLAPGLSPVARKRYTSATTAMVRRSSGFLKVVGRPSKMLIASDVLE